MTVREGGEIIDILGDPDDPEDGVDQLSVLVADTPGYILRVQPARSVVPLTLTPVAVPIVMRRAGRAAPYDHVRIHLQYDPDVFVLTDPVALRRSMPLYFTNVVIRCAPPQQVPESLPATTIVTNACEGDLWIEAWCPPTNAEGPVCTVMLTPVDTEEESELLLAFDQPGAETTVTRLGVDLLGSVHDDEDGVEGAWMTVTYVNGLRLAFVPEAMVNVAGKPAHARLVLRKELSDFVGAEQVQLELLFDSNLFDTSSLLFTPAPAVATGLWATLQVTGGVSVVQEGGALIPWTNSACGLDLLWTNNALVISTNELHLGTLTVIAKQPGRAGFLLKDSSVTRGFAQLLDYEMQASEWPVSFSVVVEGENTTAVRVVVENLAQPGSGWYPGQVRDLVVRTYGATFTNASYDLYWTYDPERVRIASCGPGCATSVLMTAGTTAHVLRVSGVVTTGATTELARVRCEARRPGTVILEPVMAGSPFGVACQMTAEGRDVLGAASIADDGVAPYTAVVKPPERVDLRLMPAATLYYGGDNQLLLQVNNPAGMVWDTVHVSLLFDADSFLITNDEWHVSVPGSTRENRIETVRVVREGRTGLWYRATLCVQLPALTNSMLVARLPVVIISDEPFWLFETEPGQGPHSSYVAYDGLELSDPTYLNGADSEAWIVYSHGLSIWLSDMAEPPVLSSNYVLTIRVNNPHGLCVERVTFCWYFDALVIEAGAPSLLPGVITNRAGFLLVNNFNSDESYVAGDVRLSRPTTNADIPVVQFTIRPKLNQLVEITPGRLDLSDESELEMGVWHPAGFNALALGSLFPEDACPIWQRGVVWVDVPQLVFEDLELEPYESAILTYDDIFYQGDDGRMYAWGVVGPQEHVTVTPMPQTRSLVVQSLDAWQGEACFVVYCQRVGSPYVGWATLRVIVGDPQPDLRLAVEMPRTAFLADKGRLFQRATFTILNAVTDVWVNARLLDTQRVWHTAEVRDDVSGTSSTAVLMRTRGRVIVDTPRLALGRYLGRVEARYGSPTNPPQAVATFQLEVFLPGRDKDGDSFYLAYHGATGWRAFTERVVAITGGADDDRLIMHVTPGPQGDGFVALESITSDSGLKYVRLLGDCGVIDVNGPLGTVRVDGGIVDEVIVRRGELKALIVKNKWGGKDSEFLAEVGIRRRVDVQRDIGLIAVYGGSIGASDEPATIISRYGAIKSVQTKALVKTYTDDGWRTTVVAGDEGANMYAHIHAPRGAIGSIGAAGGVIGAPDDDPLCTIRAAGAVGRIMARAVNCEGEAIGGSLFADVSAGGPIQAITVMGGDITRTEIWWPEDIGDEDVLPVVIAAPSIGAITVSGKAFAYDGMRDGFGGNLRAAITVSNSLGALAVKGGNACVQVFTEGQTTSIGSVSVRPIGYKEWNDDTERTWRGGNLISSTIATTPARAYRSPNPLDYRGTIGKLAIAGAIVNTWIGLKGPDTTDVFAYDRFSYARMEKSEIWEAKAGRIYIRGDYRSAR
ncbi:MAG: hypothetical protein N2595_03465 [bacterium]|nr:hypothetical protein [bacterium]